MAHQRVKLSWHCQQSSAFPDSAFPDIPSLICQFNVSNERWVLIVGEDILEQGFEVTCLVINRYLLVGQTKVWLPFEKAARPIFCRAIEQKCPCLSMYITLTGIQNGEPVSLARAFSARASAELEVALCELTYYHQWYNIRSANKNIEVFNGKHVTQILDGYYNVCKLNEDVFKPLSAELHMHTPTGCLQMSARKRLV